MAGWIGRTLSKVEIQSLLGRGGMAEVYLGLHTTLNRPVAVKILHGHLSNDATLLARFRSEAQSVAHLRHPAIVQVYDFDVIDDQPYIVMELLQGPSLDDYLQVLRRKHDTLPPQTIARLITYIAAALDYAHAHGIVHRDVKPSNVLLRRESGVLDLKEPLPEDALPVLTDFGIARLANATIRTASGVIVGTPAYMSPEQVSGESVDSRADIYALGIMLYEMLSGRLPFQSDSETVAATLIKHITEPPPPMPEVTPTVEAVVMRALAKDRNQRYQTAGELAADLQAAMGISITPIAVGPITPPPDQKAPARTRITQTLPQVVTHFLPQRVVLLLGILLIAIILGGLALLFGSGLLNNDEPTQSASGVGGAVESLGTLSFADGTGVLDQVVINAENIPAPPDDMRYEVWLLGGETRRSIGVLDVTPDGNAQLTFTDDSGQNLLANFGRFEITMEPNPDSNPLPTSDIRYSGAVPSEPLTHIRHLLVAFVEAPDNIGLTIGIVNDAHLLDDITQAMLDARQSDNLPAIKRQAEGLVNLIEGESGEHYGDLDGDGTIYSPGDGYGLLPGTDDTGYIQGSIEHARYAAGSPEASANIISNAANYEIAAQTLGGWAAQLRDTGLAILNSEDIDAAGDSILQAADLTDQFLNGQGTGLSAGEPVPQDGGLQTAYYYARHMADMPVLPGANQMPAPAVNNPNTTASAG